MLEWKVFVLVYCISLLPFSNNNVGRHKITPPRPAQVATVLGCPAQPESAQPHAAVTFTELRILNATATARGKPDQKKVSTQERAKNILSTSPGLTFQINLPYHRQPPPPTVRITSPQSTSLPRDHLYTPLICIVDTPPSLPVLRVTSANLHCSATTPFFASTLSRP